MLWFTQAKKVQPIHFKTKKSKKAFCEMIRFLNFKFFSIPTFHGNDLN